MIDQAMSLRLRLAIVMGTLFLFAILALYLAARSYAQVAADRSFDRMLGGSALSIMETISVRGRNVSVDIPYVALDMLSAAPEDRVFYAVAGPDRRIVTGYRNMPERFDQSPTGQSSASERIRFFDALYGGEDVRFAVLGREIAQPGATGWVWVQVGQTRRARNDLQQELVLRALLPIVAVTLLASATVWFGITSALRPLRSISSELAGREPSNLQPIVSPVPAEIAPVIQSLNEFMRRLRSNIERLRGFIADAAHQMRTPLAVLLAQAQASAGGDAQELRETLVRIERNASKLTRLVNQLLSDATVHHRSDVRRFERFDLLPIIEHTMREIVPQDADSDVRFKSAVREAVVEGDPVMLSEVLKNLIHNALRHGYGDFGEVSVGLDQVAGGYLLTVEDRGPGIPAEERENAFVRFSRGNADVPGAGLGLSIVKDAVLSHGGSVELQDRAGGGLRVEVRLPGVCV